jgi:hypothetical protein
MSCGRRLLGRLGLSDITYLADYGLSDNRLYRFRWPSPAGTTANAVPGGESLLFLTEGT